MRMSKLTLSADKELIRQAKKLAAQNGTSVSAMFSRMLSVMGRTSGLQGTSSSPHQESDGLIRLPSAAEDSGFSKMRWRRSTAVENEGLRRHERSAGYTGAAGAVPRGGGTHLVPG